MGSLNSTLLRRLAHIFGAIHDTSDHDPWCKSVRHHCGIRASAIYLDKSASL
jgi:hypothetical protein